MDHPVNATFSTSLKRSRLRLLVMGFMLFPHMVYLMAWAIPQAFVASWMNLSLLFRGRAPENSYNYMVRHFQYQSRIGAWSLLLTEKFPPYNGTDPYETMTTVRPPEDFRQSRLSVLFRFFLVIPAVFVAYAYALGLIFVASVAALAVLFLGRIPEGQWRFIARAHVYFMRVGAYIAMLTDVSPVREPEGAPYIDGPKTGEPGPTYGNADGVPMQIPA